MRCEVESLLSSHDKVGGFLHVAVPATTDPAAAPRRALLQVGRIIRHYRLVELIASGGMGDVFRAEDLALWLSVSGRAVCAVTRSPLLFYREPRRVEWAKFRVSQRDRLRALWRLGRPRTRTPVIWWHASRTLASLPAYRVSGWFGQQRLLLRRRSRSLRPRERAWAVRVLERLLARPLELDASRAGRES